MGSLKDAFFLALDDVQLRVNDELDGMQGRWDKLTDATWYYLLALQESQLGQMATSGLDDILTRSEEAMAKYMPLTATLREFGWRVVEGLVHFTQSLPNGGLGGCLSA